jgi:hypothetical protein
MNIFDIFAAAKFEYAVYSNLAATGLLWQKKTVLVRKLPLPLVVYVHHR